MSLNVSFSLLLHPEIIILGCCSAHAAWRREYISASSCWSEPQRGKEVEVGGGGGVLERASVYVFDGAQVGKGEERKMDD